MSIKKETVNDSLTLLSRTEGLTFGTDALLLAAYMPSGYARAIEYGAGTGIISMLALNRNKIERVDALEVQAAYAALIEENAKENGLCDRLRGVCTDLRDYTSECVDLIYTNPPYMKTTSGKHNENDEKTVARHEVFGTIDDFLACAKVHLRWGGDFFAVYRPDRLCDLIAAMRTHGIEPKRMTLVHADAESEPSMMLIEGRRGGKGGMTVTPPLLLYKDRSHSEYGEDMREILETGYFPARFDVRRKEKRKKG